MKLEQKKLSNTELMLYPPLPLPLIGTFYQDEHPLIKNISDSGLAKEVLLTTDFLYIQSDSPEHLKDLEMLSIAELDDYITADKKEEIAPLSNITNKLNLILYLVVAPMLQRDGGNIALQSYVNGTVNVRFLGKCQGCPYANRTLENHVKTNLMRYLPQVKEVVLV